MFPPIVNQLQYTERQYTSVNEKIASLDERDNKDESDGNKADSVAIYLNDPTNNLKSKYLKRAWEEKPISHTDLINNRFKKAQEESQNFYFKSKTIIGRRPKVNIFPLMSNRNAESIESIAEKAEGQINNPICELPMIELEESKELSSHLKPELEIDLPK